MGGDGLSDIRTFSLFPFTAEAVRLLNRCGVLVYVVTNQSHIAKGSITQAQFDERVSEMATELAAQGAGIDGVYCCPHARTDGCACKKPRTGLLEQCAHQHSVDLGGSYVVGDNGSNDTRLARAAGCSAVLVRTGIGEGSLGPYRHLWSDIEPDYVAGDLLDAAQWIERRESANKTAGGDA